jgi:pimeloyl-ACP methyl ester carboxylesterase
MRPSLRVVLLSCGCAIAASASWAATPSSPNLRWESHAVQREGGETTFELGYLTVPENRSRPEGRAIEVAFIRLPSTGDRPSPPLVFLAGGPGQPATPMVRSARGEASLAPLRALGDVILLDQRGVGLSRPSLACERTGAVHPEVFLGTEAAARDLREGFAVCVGELRARGIELSAYNTRESADDLEDLRRALGAEKLRLLGFSYGTHLGLTAIRRHGDRLDRVVLVGTEGPDHTWKLPGTMDAQIAKLGVLAAADRAIANGLPDLAGTLGRVLRRLDAEPLEVVIPDRGAGGEVTVAVGGWGVRRILLQDLGDTSDLPYFPALIHQLDRRETGLLRWFVDKRYNQMSRGLPAMNVAMDCASGVSPERESRIRAEAGSSLFGNAMNDLFDLLCPVLGDVRLEEAFRAPLVSDVATLLVSGTLDANTPPFQAEELRWAMPRAQHLVVENAGHEDLLTNPEVQRAIGEFLATGETGTARIAAPPLRFVPLDTGGR